MTDHPSRQRLIRELDRLSGLRQRSGDDVMFRARRALLRTWQAARLARTHADLLASPRYGDAARFFLTDLYGPQDVSRHSEDVRRIVPLMTRMLPVAALETVADALELDALSEELDAAMASALGAQVESITPQAYGGAYRQAGRSIERGRQIDLIAHLGDSLEGLTRQPFIGGALRMMRKPAVLAGLGDLQAFLERGYSAFRTMGRGGDFVATIVTRERALSNALLAGDDSGLA